MKKTSWLVELIVLVLALAALGVGNPPVVQATWIEIGDAGSLPGSAQVIPEGNWSLPSISGNLETDLFGEDMYRIFVSGPSFSASTVGGSLADTQLFLFDAAGNGLLANDDDPAAGPRSTIPPMVLASGFYFLAISRFDSDPVDALGNLIFPTFPYDGVFGPNDGVGPIAGWTGTASIDSEPYTIFLSGVSAVPEPGSLLLLGSGLAGLGALRRGSGQAWRRKIFKNRMQEAGPCV